MLDKTTVETRLVSGPDPVDIHVGQRLRVRRKLMGFSQEQLGRAVGITLQQVQKYEKGANRISASKLYRFAEMLDIQVAYFFDGIDNADEDNGVSTVREEHVDRRETLELVRNYYAIANGEARQALFDAVKNLARSSQDDKAYAGA